MFPLKRISVFLLLCFGLLPGCVSTPAHSQSEGIIVEKIGGDPSTKPAMQYQQLGVELMRYADRYAARMVLEADRIGQQATTAEMRRVVALWKLASETAATEIAVGPNYVENLLDMLVLASLNRIQIENYWMPEVIGKDLGQGLLKASIMLEEEIWGMADGVLTPDQQEDLLSVARDWYEQNPDQHNFWAIRLAGFSDQRAIDLQRVGQKGGLLGQISQTREAADEIRYFGERLLYYIQRAPELTRLQTELGMLDAVSMAEVVQVLDNTERLTRSTERYADMIEQLPTEREAAIVQMFAQLSREREATIIQMFEQLSRERNAAITQLVTQEREVFKELLNSQELKNAVDHIGSQGGEIVNTTFIRGALLILIWLIAYVVAKLAYDVFKRRVESRRQS